MPQMFEYCGKSFKVFKRAHKTCDTIHPVAGLRIAETVHLDLRCDGKAYGGCQAACLLFWKEAWLKPVADGNAAVASVQRPGSARGDLSQPGAGCTENDVWTATRHPDDGGETRYACQAIQLPYYTSPLAWWDVRQYIEDYTSGNVTLGQLLSGLAFKCFYYLSMARKDKLGAPSRWLYDGFQSIVGGIPYPKKRGRIPGGTSTPAQVLNLQPGELVRVKSYEDILATVDAYSRNRGMNFDAEMVPFCGRTYRVRQRIERFIDEKTGKMTGLKTPAVILDGAWCQSRYSDCRMFCPRAIFPWWREIWLERVSEPAASAGPSTPKRSTAPATKNEPVT